MVSIPKNLSPKEQMYGLISAYIDGLLSRSDQDKFSDIITSQNATRLEEKFADYKGKLQGAFNDHFINENQRQKLLSIGSTIGTRLQSEITESNKLKFVEITVLMKRYAVVILTLAIFVFAAVKVWLPQTYEKFKPLDYLGWEAQAFDEDPEGRLDFPSNKYEEVKAFLTAYPNLKFNPDVLAPMNSNIMLLGATVIDYEPTKVAVVMYKQKDSQDSILHFSYAGKLTDLPQAPQGNLEGFIWQSYSSEFYNLVAWENKGVVSFFVGRQATKDLAELAKLGTGR